MPGWDRADRDPGGQAAAELILPASYLVDEHGHDQPQSSGRAHQITLTENQ